MFDFVGGVRENGCVDEIRQLIGAAEALSRVHAALDLVDPDRSGLPAAARLELARAARRASDRVHALAQLLVGEADQHEASLAAAGTPMSSWLAVDGKLTKRESAGLLFDAKALVEHPTLGEAAVAGRVGAGQVRSITKVMDAIAPQLDPAQAAQAEALLVGLARRMDAEELARSAPAVLAEVAPASANELLETKLQRQAEAAQQNRSLVFANLHNGSTSFKGSLPTAECEAWIALLDAYVESQRRNLIEARDPLSTTLSRGQRYADALIGMVRAHQQDRRAPSVGGDRPRVVVKLDYESLVAGAAGAGLLGDDPLSAGELRRLCCDAELLPAVLGAESEVLDFGRSARLVTPAIRQALTLRDGGCAFPGCDTRPTSCEAHHITPWWAGGRTALSNLVLLCHHHHGLVEPAKHAVRDQWEIRLARDGLPEAVPPRRYDPQRAPLRHSRLKPLLKAG